MQGMVQYMLEEEVTEFLGRLKSARRPDSDSGYRNGYAPPRRLTLSSRTIRVQSEEAAASRHRGEVREQSAAAVRQLDQQGGRSDPGAGTCTDCRRGTST